VTLDPYTTHDVPKLKARGLRVVHELISVVEERAKSAGEDFVEACARLPQAWQATMLLAHVLDRFEKDEFIPEIVRDMPEIDDRTLVIAALKEIREPNLARAFSDAEEVIDEDPKLMWRELGPPEPEALVRLHKKIYALVSAMDEPFPSAE
jgi:hypothetical protein